MRQRVLAGLGMVTLVIGVDLALAWGREDTSQSTPLYVLGGVLIGGIIGEALGIERRLEALGDKVQARLSSAEGSTVSEGFVSASLLFCVGSLTVVGSIQDGLTGDYQTLATKAVLDGFAAIALAATLGWGVGLSVFTILIVQGGITLGAGRVRRRAPGRGARRADERRRRDHHRDRAQAARPQGRPVGNFLPALVVAPCLVGLVSLF